MRFVVGTLRVIGRILYAGLVTALVSALVWIGLFVVLPEVAPQSCDVNSGVPGTWRGDLPHARHVTTVDKIDVAGVASPQGGTWAGLYNPVSHDIQVVKGAAALTLAHEYGHALLHDLLLARCADRWEADALFARIEVMNQSSGPDGLPVWLTAAYHEYECGSPTLYGSAYFGDSFGEDFAESFAYYTTRAGADVPPVMTALLAGAEKSGR